MNRDWQWRWTAEWGRMFGLVDVRALLPLVLFFVHMRMWTLKIVLAAVVFFIALGFLRIRPGVALWTAWWTVMRWAGKSNIRGRRNFHGGNLL
jgi:hypothetical protein